MTWEELSAQHNTEWKQYFDGYQKSLEQLSRDKLEVMQAFNFMNSTLPRAVQRVLDKDQKEWQQEWGIDGWRGKELKAKHEKETKNFYEKERIKKGLGIYGNRNQGNEGNGY